MLKSGEISPTLFPTRLLVWSSPPTAGDLLADGVSVGICGVVAVGTGVYVGYGVAVG